MDARNSIDPGILLFLPTAGGGTVICQYFSKARCFLAAPAVLDPSPRRGRK